MFKQDFLGRSNILSISGAIMNSYLDQNAIVPAWRRGMSNTVWSSSAGDGDGGDRVIANYEVHGNLLLTIGWGDGFAVRQLNDDGTMTKLFHETNALYRDTTITYNHISSMCIHKPSMKAVIMTNNVNGYSIIDYSPCFTGGAAIIEPRPPSQYFIDTDGIKVDRAGYWYDTGLVTAGDWVYVGDYDATHYKKFPRRNIVTGVEEVIDGTITYVTGSKIIDRNGYHYKLRYDEVNDRVFYIPYYNGNFVIIMNASTATPEVLYVDATSLGYGDDSYEQGLYIEDPVNSPNIMFISAGSRIVEIDITPCFTGLNPTNLKVITTDTGRGQTFGAHVRFGVKNFSFTGDSIDKSELYPGYIPLSSDRGRLMLDGWIDLENQKLVALYRHDSTTEDTTTLGRGRSYRSDYSSPIFKMFSPNGTPYWVKVGYGYDGHGFRVWDDSIGPYLIDNYEVIFGNYTLDDSSNIHKVFIIYSDKYIVPSGCSLDIFVSNNGGISWEAYNYTINTPHIFTTTGNTLQVKINGYGFPDKGPYIMENMIIHYGRAHRSERESNVKFKISRTRLTGGN